MDSAPSSTPPPPSPDDLDPAALFQKRLAARSIPREKVPARIGDMDVTPALLDDYAGHERLLRERAKLPPHCWLQYDALRLCLVRRVTDAETCARVVEAYRPCARELQRDKARRIMALDDERRKLLAAKARVLEAAAAEDAARR